MVALIVVHAATVPVTLALVVAVNVALFVEVANESTPQA